MLLELCLSDRDALLNALGWAEGANSPDAQLIRAIREHIETTPASAGIVINLPAGADAGQITVVTSYDPDVVPVYLVYGNAPTLADQQIDRQTVTDVADDVVIDSVVVGALDALKCAKADLRAARHDKDKRDDMVILFNHIEEICRHAADTIRRTRQTEEIIGRAPGETEDPPSWVRHIDAGAAPRPRIAHPAPKFT